MEWAEKNGIDNSRVIVLSTSNMELAYQAILDAANSHEFDCIVLDSYPALAASEEEDKTMDQNTMTLGARRTGQFFRKVGGSSTRRDLILASLSISYVMRWVRSPIWNTDYNSRRKGKELCLLSANSCIQR